MSYQPMPGTIAYRAIAWLEKQPQGTELTASMWAESIGNCDGAELVQCLKQATEEGLVKRRHREGNVRQWWYSLGDGTPPAREAPPEEDTRDPLPPRSVAPDVQPRAGQVLPGVEVPQFVQKPESEPQDAAVADAQAVASNRDSWRELTREEEAAIDADLKAGKPVRAVALQAHAEQLTTIEQRSQAAREKRQPTPFDCWLSGVSGELVLQGVERDADGDVILDVEQVAAVRALLTGAA